ncbi:alpha/beta fold hydrolase [Pontibacter lucknowensis]|uniref:Sigma-B regulation protein RsbQ n=1 Tax=Pontibacter lucknowensis TaxID=1077936 RepID=A0A1N6UC65_9BACT|nr:alpha/beta hydrolase [Pontibacter lucknowensis]SIQ63091.1 sigma-B regulation protein RsbQ [Pontibacter lucknowensis]
MNAIKRNNVTVTGKGEKPMLFAHGYGCDQNMWRYITPAFQDDYKIILFDHIGFGNSDASTYSKDRYSSLHGYATDVLEICYELDLQDVIFVGHSVSAMIGVLAAIQEPERFSKLVLVSPSPSFINDGDYYGGFNREDIEGLLMSLDGDYLGWSNTIAPVIMGNAERPELARELAQSFCKSNPEIANDFAHITFLSDHRRDLPQVKTDTLILQCSEDAIAPPPVGEYTHRSIAGSKITILEATGHCPNLSAPEETIKAIKNFL